MAVQDNYPQHLDTWHGFTRLVRNMTVLVVVVIIVLAFVTL
ncbi:MAG: aa3-type cytochrome c oxidase subunit IV [Stellaceae bacterium]